MIPCRPRLAEAKPRAVIPRGVCHDGSPRFLNLSARSRKIQADSRRKATLLATPVRQTRSHQHESLQNARNHEPLSLLGSDPVTESTKAASNQEAQQTTESLLIWLLELICPYWDWRKVAGDCQTQLSHPTSLKPAPDVACLRR